MSNVETLARAAKVVSREGFAAGHTGFFLVVYPPLGPGAAASVTRWETGPDRLAPATQPVDACSIEKSERNPYVSRISLGRADNCDVVLRYASISKLHAHFRQGPRGRLELIDVGSRNGTRVNDRPLTPHEPRALAAGDVILFGTVPARIVDAGELFDLLHA